jgi:glycosyltransferase involved in cell wall biosynthesis
MIHPAATTVLFFIVYPYRMAGANRSLLELVTNLPASVRPIVALTDEGRAAQAFRAAGVEVHVLRVTGELNRHGGHLTTVSPLRGAWIALRELLPFTLRLRRFIRRHRVDVVHANDVRGALVAGPAAVLAGRPMVMHLRGEMNFSGATRLLSERMPARIIAVSQAARRTLSPRAQPRSIVVYNGIRTPPPARGTSAWLAALRARGVTIVSCFASVVPNKGHACLLRAVAELNRRGWADRLAVLCVGDLPAEYERHVREMQELTRALQVDNVTFAGWQDDPVTFYQYTDVAVLPSLSEGLSRANLESMAHALPIVASRIDSIAEQVRHGETGLLVEPGDPTSLADAIERLLADPELARSMGRNGRARVNREFSTAAYVAGVVECYESLPHVADRVPAAKPLNSSPVA